MIYVNDIIDKRGCVSQTVILDKLKNKSNWISEINIIKKSIPAEWLRKLKSEESTKSIVNINRTIFRWKNNNLNVIKLSNKILYTSFVQQKYDTSIGLSKWVKLLNIKEICYKNMIYEFIFRYLEENRLKTFRWKLLQFIIPTKKLLFLWKISNNPLCNFCGKEEDYQHYFISCSYFLCFWNKIYETFSKCKIDSKVNLKDLVLGYKIFDKGFFGFNFFLTILSF